MSFKRIVVRPALSDWIHANRVSRAMVPYYAHVAECETCRTESGGMSRGLCWKGKMLWDNAKRAVDER